MVYNVRADSIKVVADDTSIIDKAVNTEELNFTSISSKENADNWLNSNSLRLNIYHEEPRKSEPTNIARIYTSKDTQNPYEINFPQLVLWSDG
ncbi:hypothetical protein HHI36_010304 [Cryptolaemus montrouzieri]|uniref:Uncharacterized protein n=1 Tax=Cryptolaemus montrouzieri TaxID=559131 RepID=A0ABD2MIF6_9CUCU